MHILWYIVYRLIDVAESHEICSFGWCLVYTVRMQSVQEIVCQEIAVGKALSNPFLAKHDCDNLLYGMWGTERILVSVQFESASSRDSWLCFETKEWSDCVLYGMWWTASFHFSVEFEPTSKGSTWTGHHQQSVMEFQFSGYFAHFADFCNFATLQLCVDAECGIPKIIDNLIWWRNHRRTDIHYRLTVRDIQYVRHWRQLTAQFCFVSVKVDSSFFGWLTSYLYSLLCLFMTLTLQNDALSLCVALFFWRLPWEQSLKLHDDFALFCERML